ncbi:hypothetical protein LSAT2_032902 [Lamellibrachia satsuma]|nr:hypothetical protein LSAT2_032902 [Lamellibrachia satsuma]
MGESKRVTSARSGLAVDMCKTYEPLCGRLRLRNNAERWAGAHLTNSRSLTTKETLDAARTPMVVNRASSCTNWRTPMVVDRVSSCTNRRTPMVVDRASACTNRRTPMVVDQASSCTNRRTPMVVNRASSYTNSRPPKVVD